LTEAGLDQGGIPEWKAPTAVCVLDVERPIEPLSFTLPDGLPYRTVMLLVRRDRRPLAMQALALNESGSISASEIRTAIAPLIDDDPSDGPRQALQPARDPLISVVVPTCEGGSTLMRCIHSVLTCDYENLEVIVVDNRPSARTTGTILAERFADDARVLYAQEARTGSSYARNRGLELAKGDFVAFADDDTVVDNGWLRAIASAFTAEVSCVTGLILPLAIDTPMQALFEQFAGFGKGLEYRSFQLTDRRDDPLFPYAAGMFGSGANTAVRKSVALRLGGFDVKLGAGTPACGGEELDMYIKLLLAGEKIVYEPAAVLFHQHPSDSKGLRRRAFNYGVGLTAMLTNQMLIGPRLPLLRAAPAGMRYVLNPHSRKNAPRGRDYPRMLTMLERFGMLVGPPAYALSTGRSRTALQRPIAHDEQFVPSAVSVIELDQALADVELGHSADGREYGSLLALVRLHGDPLRMIEVPVERGRVTTSALADAIWTAAHTELERHARTYKCIEPEAVTRDALTSGLPTVGRCQSRGIEHGELPFISVIVPTARRPEQIQTCLESLCRLRYPRLEIVVVDNAPDDEGTCHLVASFAEMDHRIRYVVEPTCGLSCARNCGLRHASGDLIAYTDDDVQVDQHWIMGLLRGFGRRPDVACVTGLVASASLERPAEKYFDARVWWSSSCEPRVYDATRGPTDPRLHPYAAGQFGTGANFAFRASTLRAIGGFDESLGAGSRTGGGEDLDVFVRVIRSGYALAYEPAALVWHENRVDEDDLRRQMYAYGKGLSAYLTKYVLSRHTCLDMLRRLPHGLRHLRVLGARSGEAGARSGLDRRLMLAELYGLFMGPWSYVLARREQDRHNLSEVAP
jgi:O-antigen biosynthesis protein